MNAEVTFSLHLQQPIWTEASQSVSEYLDDVDDRIPFHGY